MAGKALGKANEKSHGEHKNDTGQIEGDMLRHWSSVLGNLVRKLAIFGITHLGLPSRHSKEPR